MGGKIDRQKIFFKNNYISIFMNLKFSLCSVTISVTDQNISNLIAPLASFSIDKENFLIEIFKHQVNHTELLPEKQLLNEDMYTSIAIITKK